MAVTFLTDQDKALIDVDLENLSREIQAGTNNSVLADYLVPFWGESAKLEIGDYTYPIQRIGVVRNGSTVLLTGEASGASSTRVTLSGELKRANTNTNVNAIERTLELIEGHEYEVKIQKLGGSYTGTDIRCLIYAEGANEDGSPITEAAAILDDATGKGNIVFTASSGKYLVVYRFKEDTIFSNLELGCTITDLTEQRKDTVISQLFTESEKKIGYMGTLVSTDDLNNIANGVYRVDYASLPANVPAEKPCSVIQYGHTTSPGAVQLVLTSDGRLFERYRASGGWNKWWELAKKEDVDSAISQLESEINSLDLYTDFIKHDVDIRAMTNGELYAIPTTGHSPLIQYAINDSGEIYETDEGNVCTDYMQCPKYLLINFNPDKQARLIIYFYDLVDGEYVPRWDLLKIVTSTNMLNYINYTTVCNRVIEIPDGVYMRVSQPKSGDVSLYGWSGVHVGCEMATTAYAPEVNENGGYDEVNMNTKRVGLTVPGEATLLWMKDCMINYLWGVKEDGTEELLYEANYLQVVTLPSGYKYFRAKLSLDYTVTPENSHGGANDIVCAFNMNDKISCLCDFTVSRPFGRAREVIDNAKAIANIEWECKKDHLVANTEDKYFYAGTKYNGVPYGSMWQKPCYFGWHISKHTFLNAANDEDSVFYTDSGRNGGTGYSTVCSAFATLCAGWPNPVVTAGFLKDPHVSHYRTNIPPLGEILYNGDGHTIIPETTGEGKGFSEYTIYESVAPMTLRRSHFDFLDNGSRNTRSWSYINDYVHAVHHDSEVGHPNCYNVNDGYIVNGTARPNRGDRSVYTSDDDVLINIKDSTATICYVQRCAYTRDSDEFTAIRETPVEYTFNAGTKQISLNKENLVDGWFYGVYTDVDNTMEYFEYHVAPTSKYDVTDDTITFDNTATTNVLSGKIINEKTTTGVTCEWIGNNVHIYGTPTSSTNWVSSYGGTSVIPDGFTLGRTYTLKMNSNAFKLCARYYHSDGSTWLADTSSNGEATFTIPLNSIGFAIYIVAKSSVVGTEVDEMLTPEVITANDWWYSSWWMADVPSGIVEIIPYEPSGDYSEYRQVYNPNGADGAMFYKGVLGAYMTTLTCSDQT